MVKIKSVGPPWAMGGGEEGMHPPEGQKQVPSPAPEKWVPITKNPWSILHYTPFSWPFLLCCACRFFHQTEKFQQLANDWKKSFFYLAANTYFLSYVKFSLPPFTRAMAAKKHHLPTAIFDPCTHEKNFFPPFYEKSGAHVCVGARFFFLYLWAMTWEAKVRLLHNCINSFPQLVENAGRSAVPLQVLPANGKKVNK